MRAAACSLLSVMRRLAEEDTSPARLGVAVGVGVLFACTPFFGFQLALALMVAWPLRLNKLAVALGTQLSLPPLIPFLAYTSVNLGELILHRQTALLTPSQISRTPPSVLITQIGLAWSVGGIALGLVAGSVIGAIVTLLASRIRANRGSDVLSVGEPGVGAEGATLSSTIAELREGD